MFKPGGKENVPGCHLDLGMQSQCIVSTLQIIKLYIPFPLSSSSGFASNKERSSEVKGTTVSSLGRISN